MQACVEDGGLLRCERTVAVICQEEHTSLLPNKAPYHREMKSVPPPPPPPPPVDLDSLSLHHVPLHSENEHNHGAKDAYVRALESGYPAEDGCDLHPLVVSGDNPRIETPCGIGSTL